MANKAERIKIERPSFDKDALKADIKKKAEINRKAADRKKNAPKGTEAPDYWAFLEDAEFDNPFWDRIGDTGDVEENSNIETEVMSDALRRILEEKRARKKAYALLVDTSYFVTLVFQTTEQKNQFIEEKGWHQIDGNFQYQFLNGLEVADVEGVDIEPVYIPTKEPPTTPKDLRDHPIIGE